MILIIIFLYLFFKLNFLTPWEINSLINILEKIPWEASQSGRRKQVLYKNNLRIFIVMKIIIVFLYFET